jgi:hypothetical protein
MPFYPSYNRWVTVVTAAGNESAWQSRRISGEGWEGGGSGHEACSLLLLQSSLLLDKCKILVQPSIYGQLEPECRRELSDSIHRYFP